MRICFFLCIVLVTCSVTAEDTDAEFFNSFDTDKDSKISWGELLAGLWQNRKVSLHEFAAADEDGNGFLQGPELQKKYAGKTTFKELAEATKTLDEEGQYLEKQQYVEAIKQVWAAQIHGPFEEADTNKDDHLDMSEFHPMHDKLVASAKSNLFNDANSDSDAHITHEEWKQMVYHGGFHNKIKAAMSFFESADIDGDEILTLEEFLAHNKENTKEKFEAFVPTDTVDKTSVTKEQFSGFADHQFHYVADKTFKDADTDTDGKVTKSEFENAKDYGMNIEL